MIDVGRMLVNGKAGRFQLPELGTKGFSHVLMVGETGSGKSTTMTRLVDQGARRPDVALVLLDFKGGMELKPWMPAATVVIDSPGDAVGLLQEVRGMLEARAKMMAAVGQMEGIAVRFHEPRFGPKVLLACDELGELKSSPLALSLLDSVAAMARAVGFGVVAATQYAPKSDYPSRLLVNLRSRIVHRMGTQLEYAVSLRTSIEQLDRWGFEGFTVDDYQAVVSGISGVPDGALVKATVVPDEQIPDRAQAAAQWRWRPEQVFTAPPAKWVLENYPSEGGMMDDVTWLGQMPGDGPEDVCQPERPAHWGPEVGRLEPPPMLPAQTHPGFRVRFTRHGLFLHRASFPRLSAVSEWWEARHR